MFYVCENQLVFFPFINAVIYSIHPFSIRPGQGCRAPLRGVPGGGLRFGLCFCGLVISSKKTKRKSFSHFIITSLHLSCFFFGGGPTKNSGNLGIESKLCPSPDMINDDLGAAIFPSTAAWLGFSRNSSQLPWRWRKPMPPWMWRMPW